MDLFEPNSNWLKLPLQLRGQRGRPDGAVHRVQLCQRGRARLLHVQVEQVDGVPAAALPPARHQALRQEQQGRHGQETGKGRRDGRWGKKPS